MRKLIILAVCLAMVPFATFAAGGPEAGTESASAVPAYLNLAGAVPVHKAVQKDVVLKVAAIRPASGGNWNDLWIGKYVAKFLNLQLAVEQIDEGGRNERVALMFAAGDVPDMLLFLGLTPTEIMDYGVINHQLKNLAPYLDAKLTPSMWAWKQKRPDAFASAHTPDGAMYTLPMVRMTNDAGSVPRLFVNQKWLEKAGLKMPSTLDEFLAMGRAFKKFGANIVPFGGAFYAGDGQEYLNIGYYFLNALGYVTERDNAFGSKPAIRNGECELPAGNAKLFKAYLETLHTAWTDGLFSEDFFVADRTAAIAQLLDNRVGVYGEPVYVTGIKTWADWWAVKPLTSAHNPKPAWTTPPGVGVGNFAMGAKSKYPLTAMRFADLYYSQNSRMYWLGPKSGSPEAMGLRNSIDCLVENKYTEDITDLWTYLMAKVTPYPGFGTYDTEGDMNYYLDDIGHPEFKPDPNKKWDLTDADSQYRAGVAENMLPVASDTFPNIYYLDQKTTERLADLKAVIDPFLKEQVARFMKGDRPLSEFDAFQAELKKIGFAEYEKVYKNIWASYVAALKKR